MKRIKIAFALVATVAALSTSFAFRPTPKVTNLFWVAADGTDDGQRTQASEVTLRGCNENFTKACAKGYQDSDHTILVTTLHKQ